MSSKFASIDMGRLRTSVAGAKKRRFVSDFTRQPVFNVDKVSEPLPITSLELSC
jgi:hypothetical protein